VYARTSRGLGEVVVRRLEELHQVLLFEALDGGLFGVLKAHPEEALRAGVAAGSATAALPATALVGAAAYRIARR